MPLFQPGGEKNRWVIASPGRYQPITHPPVIAPGCICQCVPEHHPILPGIQQLRDDMGRWLAEHPGSFIPTIGERWITRTLFHAEKDPGGFGPFQWIYLSAQIQNAQHFRAWTFFYRAQREQMSVYEFPKDPKLSALTEFFKVETKREQHQRRVYGINVLRYIPRRRLTFEVPGTADHQKTVGKFVRTYEAEPLYEKLRHLQQQVRGELFRIPAVQHVDCQHGLIYQTKEEGNDLTQLLTADNSASLLRHAGRIHAEIHRLNLQPGEEWNVRNFMTRVWHDTHWLISFLPEHRQRLESILQTWKKRQPSFAAEDMVFCHGDFKSSHLLVRPDKPWVVIDFDGYLKADRHWEMAWFITLLRRDVPFLSAALAKPGDGGNAWIKEAISAYVAGYLSTSPQGFSQANLNWFLVAAELQYMVRSIQRDLASPSMLQHLLEHVQQIQS